MTLALTTKLKLFIHRMSESEEQAQWGFELLLKRADFEEFFDYLGNAGLFTANNPATVPVDGPRHDRVPLWSALNYLVAVAKRAGERNDLHLAEKVMGVIRNVSRAHEPDSNIRDNYPMYRTFAEILGLVRCHL